MDTKSKTTSPMETRSLRFPRSLIELAEKLRTKEGMLDNFSEWVRDLVEKAVSVPTSYSESQSLRFGSHREVFVRNDTDDKHLVIESREDGGLTIIIRNKKETT